MTVVVVGSANVDLVAYVDRAPEAGETVMGSRFVVAMGGKGANQAVMAARLGAAVAFVGCVGDDPYGREIRDNLAAEGIDVTGLATVPGSSGVAPIWVDRRGTNRIVVVPGANAALTADWAATAVHADAAVVVGQLEVPPAATAAAFEVARARGVTTVLNPAPALPVGDDLLALCDWVIPNETEFALLTGTDPADDAAVSRYAAALGAGVVVTRGEAGALVVVPHGDPVRVPAPAVDAVDTTGAGDAFVGAFAVALARGDDPVTAATLACRCAATSVTTPGTQTSYPGSPRDRAPSAP
jgi:ribokinase